MGWVHIGVRVWEAEQRSKGMLEPLVSHQRPKLQGCQRSRGDLHQSQTEAKSQMKVNQGRILKPGPELSHKMSVKTCLKSYTCRNDPGVIV